MSNLPRPQRRMLMQAHAFRIWRLLRQNNHQLTLGEISDALEIPYTSVRDIVSRKKWKVIRDRDELARADAFAPKELRFTA